MYDFKKKLRQGEEGERHLDDYFAKWYTIRDASRDEQRRGIDRWFTPRKPDGKEFPVEYKTDWTAGKTGNAFVETVSVDTKGKLGWAYTSQSLYLIYRIPEPEVIYVLPLAGIRGALDNWRKKYPERNIPNNGYCSVGTLVPLDEFERIAVMVA